jgi:protein-disulfide isomerase
MRSFSIIATLLILADGCALCQSGGANTGGSLAAQNSPLLAEVDGNRFTMADFDRKHPGRLFMAINSYYEAQKQAVQEFVDEYLLERQAKKEGLTVEQLIEKHVNAALPPDPSEESLKVYYEGTGSSELYENVRGQILDSIRGNRQAKARAKYMESLRSEANVKLRIPPPRANVSLDGAEIRGPRDARVHILEYADYECPYCQDFQPVLDRIAAEYKDKLAIAYKDAPLPMHRYARKAAEAAHCAGAQGKYWEYHDLLFKTKLVDLPQLKWHAHELALDQSAFDKCVDSGAQAEIVDKQFNEAKGMGLQGTPAFFINGRYFSGIISYEQLRAIVEEELETPLPPQHAQTANSSQR